MSSLLRKYIRFCILLSYWIFLTKSLLTAQPWALFSAHLAESPPIDLTFEPNSWAAHILAYCILGVLMIWSAQEKRQFKYLLFFLAFLHSGICEYLQSMIPNRWPNLWDIVSNSLGLTLAFVLHRALTKSRQVSHSLKTSPKKQAV